MLFLARDEAKRWHELGRSVVVGALTPGQRPEGVRRALLPHFHFYAGCLLASAGRGAEGMSWFREGSLLESDENLGNAFFASFMERQGGVLRIPETVFADPRPYVHFTGVPTIKEARERFIVQVTRSLPDFAAPFRFIDIGCGDGALTVALLQRLREAARIIEIGCVTLVDPFPAMLEMATATVTAAFPGITVVPILGRFQDVSAGLPESDVALAALSIHHMPRETRRGHLERLALRTRHLILFELNANHDTPELNSPELTVSIYQAYGSMIDAIFAHDAPLELAVACVDRFLLGEAVSILTEPRGVRTDYHMLRDQWKEQFAETLGPDFTCLGEFTDYATDNMELITLHYGTGT